MSKNIVTFDSAEQIKKAAEKHIHKQILMEIRDRDLIAKEFCKHEKCYRDDTRILYKIYYTEEPVYDSSNYESVHRIIEEEIRQIYINQNNNRSIRYW